MPLDKSPEVLAERSSNILKKFGYVDSPADIAYGVGENSDYVIAKKQGGPTFDDWKKLESGQPLYYFFWYRQSPRPMAALDSAMVSLSDPPTDFSGMANIILDMRGRLVQFTAIPPQVDQSPPNTLASTSQSDWPLLFSEAGFNIADFTEVDSTWLPPTYADRRAAWEGAYPDHPEIPIRVEAAAYRGRPVYFQVIAPWEKPARQEEISTRPSRRAAGMILAISFFAVLIASVLLARRNLRLGRGNKRGSFKIALFVFLTTLVGALMAADHVPMLGEELSILFKASAEALFTATFFWLLYIAMEPFVRRNWPRLIISWSRLLVGDFRNPMVGRDILIGSLLGLGHTLTICSMSIISNQAGKPVPPINAAVPITLQGIRLVIASILASSVPQYLMMALGLLLLLLLLYILLRRRWLAIAALWLLFAAVGILAFAIPGPPTLWIGPLIIATLGLLAVARFGLLTTISFQLFFDLSFHYAMTPDLSAWYAQTTFITVPILITIAVYSFYTSLAGQPLVRGGILQD